MGNTPAIPNFVRTQEKQMKTKEETLENLKNAAWAADKASIAAMEAANVAWEEYIDARRKSWTQGDKTI